MKLYVFLLPLFIFLQAGSCGDDDTPDMEDPVSDNYVEFLGIRNEASGGCNQESASGKIQTCVYAGAYSNGGLGYAIALSHQGLCRTATFDLRDNLNAPSSSFFILQVTEDGVAIETYLGATGSVNVVDSGNSTSFRFNGTVISSETGEEETIEGFIECPI